MSAGPFTISKYEADNGDIYAIRVQPETLLANIGGVNAAPAGAVDQATSARVTGGNRKIGIKARSVTIRFTATPPTDYKADGLYRVPILTTGVYDAISATGTTGTYLTVACVTVGKNGERVR